MEKHKSWRDSINRLKPNELYTPPALTFVKCILTADSGYVFRTILTTKSDYICKHRKPVGLCEIENEVLC